MQETEDNLGPRRGDVVAQRVLGILASLGKVYFPSDNLDWMEEEQIWQYLSPAERAFIKCEYPSEEDKAQFSWRSEALCSLVWSLNGLDNMLPLDQHFDVYANDLIADALAAPRHFINHASTRLTEELINEEYFLYRQHWRVRDHEMKLGGGLGLYTANADDPDILKLNSGIVYERRYGMSWIVGHGNSWDDVPTDT